MMQGNTWGDRENMMVWYDWDELTAWGKDSVSSYPDVRTDVSPVLEDAGDGISGSVRDGYHPYLGYLP